MHRQPARHAGGRSSVLTRRQPPSTGLEPVALGHRSITVSTLPVWSTSSWGEKTHRAFFRSDDPEHVFEPLLAVRGRIGVDDDRLLAADHGRVQVDQQWCAERFLSRMDDPRCRRRTGSVRTEMLVPMVRKPLIAP